MTMARYRTIKPQFFDDIKVRRLSRDARLLYVGLWVFADDLGVVIGDTVWLKSKVFPYDQIQIQQFERWLNELVINGFICLLTYNGERFIYLPTFTRHQVINRPNYDSLEIPKALLDSEMDHIATFMEQSVNVHGTFSEQSVLRIRHREEENIPPLVPPGDDPAPSPPEDPLQEVVETFNARFAGRLPRVSTLTDKRRKAVAARIAEHGAASVTTVFDHIDRSTFLLGGGDKGWTCDFDWIFRPNNYVKILEGNYNDHIKTTHDGNTNPSDTATGQCIIRTTAAYEVGSDS